MGCASLEEASLQRRPSLQMLGMIFDDRGNILERVEGLFCGEGGGREDIGTWGGAAARAGERASFDVEVDNFCQHTSTMHTVKL